jgi:hypothetical protein
VTIVDWTIVPIRSRTSCRPVGSDVIFRVADVPVSVGDMAESP